MNIRKYFLFTLLAIMVVACGPATEKKISSLEGEISVVHPSWASDAVMYEINVRQFSEEGTFAGVEARLPELSKLGVKILWFMPIHPIGELNRKGELGSYYSVSDYKGVNPEFGTPDDFKRLIDKAHEMGFYVMIDWVPNHTAWDNPLVTDHPDWYDKDSLGNFIAPYDWTDVVKLNWDVQELRDYMQGALAFWVSEFDIDGFRVDHPHNTPEEFWPVVRKELEKIRPVLLLAENEDQHGFLRDGFDMNYAWNFHHKMNETAQGKIKPTVLLDLLKEEAAVYPKSVYRLRFIDNHDENSWAGTVEERMGPAERAFATLIFTAPGFPLLYNGQEMGLTKRLKFFERDPIVWQETELNAFYHTLVAAKKKNSALFNGEEGGDFIVLANDTPDKVVSYVRVKRRE